MRCFQRESGDTGANCRIRSRKRHSRRRHGVCSAQIVVLAVFFAVWAPIAMANTTGSFKALEAPYVAGSALQLWWGPRDVEAAIQQLGGVQQCPEAVNTLVDSELLGENSMLTSCRRDAADFDFMRFSRAVAEMAIPTEQQTTRMCLSEACAAWFIQVATASWLPECRYRQSEMSVRSLAETLLRIRDDLRMSVNAVAPNESVFREQYQINQIANLMTEKENEVESISVMQTPIMQVARQLSTQTDFGSVEGGNTELSSAVAAGSASAASATGSNNPTSASTTGPSSSAGNAPGSASSHDNARSSIGSTRSGSSSSLTGSSSLEISNSVGGDWMTNDSLNATDNAGFTGSGIGPHARSTATTTELGTSYAFLVGAWVLFNGSYFFLMRRK